MPDEGDVSGVKVFVGSSSEGKSHEAFLRICDWIEAAGHETVRWDSPTLFPAGESTLETLEQVAKDVRAAILIFSADDRTWYRNNESVSPRDNVVLEYGLFTGRLGRKQTAVFQLEPEGDLAELSLRVASDLAGITTIRFKPNRWASLEIQVVAFLARASTAGAAWQPPEEIPDSPFQNSGKASLFTQSTKLINAASNRIVLVARTPVLLMGPRPYGKPADHVSYEVRQFQAYRDMIERRRRGEGASILCLASMNSVAQDISRHGWDSLLEMVSGNYQFLHEGHETLDDNVSLLWHDAPSAMNFLVADQSFVIWFKDETGESIWITGGDEAVSNALVHLGKQLAAEARRYASWDEVETQLRLLVDVPSSLEAS